MAAITEDFGTGGAGLVPNGSRTPSLALALRDVADDLDAINTGISGTTLTATVTQAAVAAFTDPPTAGEMANLRTLVNQLRAAVVELQAAVAAGPGGGVTLKTTKV